MVTQSPMVMIQQPPRTPISTFSAQYNLQQQKFELSFRHFDPPCLSWSWNDTPSENKIKLRLLITVCRIFSYFCDLQMHVTQAGVKLVSLSFVTNLWKSCSWKKGTVVVFEVIHLHLKNCKYNSWPWYNSNQMLTQTNILQITGNDKISERFFHRSQRGFLTLPREAYNMWFVTQPLWLEPKSCNVL